MQNKSSILRRFVPFEATISPVSDGVQDVTELQNVIARPNRYHQIPKSVSPGSYCCSSEEKDYGVSKKKAAKKAENQRTRKYKGKK